MVVEFAVMNRENVEEESRLLVLRSDPKRPQCAVKSFSKCLFL
jgi:hypothetical protein